VPGPFHNDSGGASRFYVNADWQHEVAEQLAQADPVRYVPKAAKKERNSGLDDFYWRRNKASPTGFVRVSQEEWEKLDKRQRARGNIHPTQKPISLTKWLATLLLPPPEYAPRRIMIPFGGKMSEAIGALLAGWEEIVAIEMYQDYCDAGEARAAFWSTRQLELPTSAPLRTRHERAP
jgi:site-specific DNA-methyltransferase (adenine-specific)